MKFKPFLLLLFLLFSAVVSAQNNYEDVVYLKDGSIIHGMIIEQIPNVSIKIKSGVNVFVYKMDDIEKITKEEIQSGSGTGGDYGFKPSGFVGNYEIGLSDYPQGGNVAMFSVNLVNGYMFNPYFSLGFGVGAEISAKKVYNFPVYADMRAYLTKTRVAPYFNFATGYNALVMQSEDYYDSGTDIYHCFMFSPAFGVRFAINQKVGATFSIGYKYLGYRYSYDYYYSESGIESLHGIQLRWGVIF